MIVGHQKAVLRVLGINIKVHVTSIPVKGRVFCTSLDDNWSFGDRVGELRNSYLTSERKPVSIRVSRLRAV